MFIARALAQEAEVILMDEPLNGLDKPSQEIIFNLLNDLRRKNITVLVAMHDLDLASERFDKVMLLNRSLIGFGDAKTVFTPDYLAKAYGSHLHLIQAEEGLIALSDTCCDHEMDDN
jgi:ABC-type Mn2+/Zn2+ transport system ATPase subunit